jgi:hypothetical protein
MNVRSVYRSVSFLSIVSTMLNAQVGRTDPVLLKHWAAPVYWRPQAAAASASSPEDPSPLALVAITPCRVVDTRASQGFPPLLGAPSLVAGASRQFVLAAGCMFPGAPAYSLNRSSIDAIRLHHRLSDGATRATRPARRYIGLVARLRYEQCSDCARRDWGTKRLNRRVRQ